MELYLTTRDHAVSKERFELRYDASRDMLQTVPIPKDIDRFYQDEAYISHTDGNRTFMEKIYQLVKKYNLKKKETWINKYAKKNPRILDVGAGTGSFVAYLKERGRASHGVEPNAKARELARKKGIDLEITLNDLGKKKYDVITLWHVLEHLPDLEKYIQSITHRLADNGVLFIAVPNFRSYDAKHYGTYWAAYDVPRHLWHFSRNSIKKIFSANGYTLVASRPMLFDAFYIAQLSEKYKHGKHRMFSALWHGLRSTIYGWRTGEYSSLLYVLEKHQ